MKLSEDRGSYSDAQLKTRITLVQIHLLNELRNP